MPATNKSSSSGSKYHRPSYLRALEAYEGAKKVYSYGKGFVVVRSVAPLVERIAEGTLSRLPVIRQLKAPEAEEAEEKPTLRGIDMRVASLLAYLDDYVDTNLGNPKTLQGRVLRMTTYTVYSVAAWTPLVGRRIKQLMIDIHPDHAALSPRLMDRPALDVNGEDADLMRGSFDKDMDDVSVVTDASEEVAAAAANGKDGKSKKKKDKRKDKRFLQNMGKGIKKVINYPRTPVHDIPARSSVSADAPSIGGEEEASLGAATDASRGATPLQQPSSSSASIASTDAVASTGGSSSTASTPLRATARKFFGAVAAPGSSGKKSKAAAAAPSPAASCTSNPSSA